MFSHQVAKWCWRTKDKCNMPSFFPFFSHFFFFFFFTSTYRQETKTSGSSKKLFSCITIVNMGDFITRNPSETRLCGSAEKNECKNFSGNTSETDEGDVEILLRTQTTARQRHDEIKKLDWGKEGNNDVFASFQSRKDSQMVRCGVRGLGVGGHLNTSWPLPPALLFFPPSLWSPSLHPVSLVKLGLVLGVGVLDGDAAWQDGGHVVADALVLSLLLSLLLHFPQLYAWRGETQ